MYPRTAPPAAPQGPSVDPAPAPAIALPQRSFFFDWGLVEVVVDPEGAPPRTLDASIRFSLSQSLPSRN